MLFEISHITEYSYSKKVFFEPHRLRLKPKTTPHTTLKSCSIKIEPEPAGLSEHTDVEDNHNLLCWFDGTHQELKIESHAVVEVEEYNPFNFLVYPPEYLNIPFEYDAKTKPLLAPSLNAENIAKEIKDYYKHLAKETDNQTVDFLVLLTKKITQDFLLQHRDTGEPHFPDITFKDKKGSCRDLAWMQIHMLRQLGIACRFASGYYYIEAEDVQFELHAWVEVYLPGAGWIGIDPAHGGLTNEHYIPVASSAFYENTMPVSGTIRGNASSKLSHQLNIVHTS